MLIYGVSGNGGIDFMTNYPEKPTGAQRTIEKEKITVAQVEKAKAAWRAKKNNKGKERGNKTRKRKSKLGGINAL